MTLNSHIYYPLMPKSISCPIATPIPMSKFLKLMAKAEQATTRKKARKILKKVAKLASARQELQCSTNDLNDL